MGQVTTLIDIVKRLETLGGDATIYVAEPWATDSPAMVAIEPDSGRLPAPAREQGMTYFLEVFNARDVLKGWVEVQDETPSLEKQCERIIHYALNDA